MKVCCVCKIEKPLVDFGILKSSKDGYRYDCKKCKNERGRIGRQKNKKPKKEKYTYPSRTIKCLECGIEHTGNFSHIKKFCSKICSNKNKNNRDYVKESKLKYLQTNCEKRKKTSIDSRKKNWNLPKNIEYRKNHSQKLEIRLKNTLRSRIVKTLKSNPKTTKTTLLVGCSIEELKNHIESQFQNGMTWDNWSQFGWHLDHIIPLSSAKDIKEMESLCHYRNLQPLWWEDNLRKSNKLPEEWMSEN